MTDNKNPVKKIIIVGVIILIAVVTFAYLFGGFNALSQTIKYSSIFLLVIAVLVLAIGLVVWLFSKRRIDMLQHRKEQIIEACKTTQSNIVQELWFKGNNNVATRKIGDVVGICSAYTAPEETVYFDKKLNKKVLKQSGPPKLVYFVAFKTSSMPFVQPEIFLGEPEDFYGAENAFAGERIFLKGTHFAPKLYDQFMLAHHWEDTTFADKTASKDVQRYGLSEWNREFKDIGDSMINLDSHFKKTQELTRMEEIPGVGGE